MGFNKRYINKNNLSNYKTKKIEDLILFIKKPDCLIIEDSYSENICNIVTSTKKELLLSKLKEIGFYES